MYTLSRRCSLLRDEVVDKRSLHPLFECQRNVLNIVGIQRAKEAGMSLYEAAAEGVAFTLDHFTPVIQPCERIVGFHYGWREYYFPEGDEQGMADMRRNNLPEDIIADYLAHRSDYAEGFDRLPSPVLTDAERWSEEEWSAIGRCIDGNHTVLNYAWVLKYGFEGLYDKVCRYEEQNGTSPLYRALKRLCLAACRLGQAYKSEAERLLAEGAQGYEPELLRAIAADCAVVPAKPARTLAQAIQSLFFAHIVNCWEDNVNANSIGRLDQILYPYYQADLAEGRLTKEEAFELICQLWLKLYLDYDVQQSCIGGRSPDGSSDVNELSYMMLDATEQLGFVRCLSVRFDRNTDPAFVRRAMEVVGRVGKGVPFFFNDDVMIPSLTDAGIAYEDACDYTQIGCVETVIPGRSNPHAVTGETNLLKAMEYLLGNGQSLMYPEKSPGLATGELDAFPTYEAFYAGILAQVDRILDLTCSKVRKHRDVSAVNSPRPVKTLLTEGCVERGRDFNDAGAIYDTYQIMLGGVPNLADSLLVVKRFVYEKGMYTLAELKRILEENFPDEAVRQRFLHAPKYGNDIDEVDTIAADLIDHCCDTLASLSERYGLAFHAQPFTYLWMVDHGNTSAASPDGRRKGEIIAYSVSPMQGRDISGLTALFRSLAKLPTRRTPGTTSAIVEVDPKLFTDDNVGALTDILIEAAANGLSNVQFNTVDADTLIDAQAHPERYGNLAVRVSGFSQKFNLLSRPLQDHIIGRTKHPCL